MEVRLDQVREEPFRWQETQSIDVALLGRPEVVSVGPVSWAGEVRYVAPDFLLRARLAYQQTLSCGRCLTPFVEAIETDVELLITQEEGSENGEEHELGEEELGVWTVEEEVLDTQPILLEQLQLSLPMRPLCRESCRGICPSCGADRNREPCDCSERTTDPRWAALADLRSRFESDER